MKWDNWFNSIYIEIWWIKIYNDLSFIWQTRQGFCTNWILSVIMASCRYLKYGFKSRFLLATSCFDGCLCNWVCVWEYSCVGPLVRACSGWQRSDRKTDMRRKTLSLVGKSYENILRKLLKFRVESKKNIDKKFAEFTFFISWKMRVNFQRNCTKILTETVVNGPPAKAAARLFPVLQGLFPPTKNEQLANVQHWEFLVLNEIIKGVKSDVWKRISRLRPASLPNRF